VIFLTNGQLFHGFFLSAFQAVFAGKLHPSNMRTVGLHCTYPFLFENGDFFLRFGFPPTRIRRKQSPKRIFSKTLSTVVIFKNAVLLYSCGRLKTEDFENDFVTVYLDPV